MIAQGKKFRKAITAEASDVGDEFKAEGVSYLYSIIKILKDFTSRETFPRMRVYFFVHGYTSRKLRCQPRGKM